MPDDIQSLLKQMIAPGGYKPTLAPAPYMSPDQIKFAQERYDQAMKPATNLSQFYSKWGGAANAFDKALAGWDAGQANRSEQAGRQQAQQDWMTLLGGGGAAPSGAPSSPSGGLSAPGGTDTAPVTPSGSAAPTQVASSDVVNNVNDAWTNQGMSANGVRGILYNINRESSFNPGLRHPDQPNFGGEARYAHGLYQEGGDEWNNYTKWLSQNHPGGDWRNHELQNEFAAQNLKNNYPKVWASMVNAETPEEAAKAYVSGYLKPSSTNLAGRIRDIDRNGVPEINSWIKGGGTTQTPPSSALAFNGSPSPSPSGQAALPPAAGGTPGSPNAASIATPQAASMLPMRGNIDPATFARFMTNPYASEAQKTALLQQSLKQPATFGVIGQTTDAFGNQHAQYGFIDPYTRTVTDLSGNKIGGSGGAGGAGPGGQQQGLGFDPTHISWDLNGDEFLKQFPKNIQTQVLAYQEGRQMPTGNPRSPMTQMVKQIATKYGDDTRLPVDDTTFNARKTMRNNLQLATPGSLGGQINSYNTAVGHLSDMAKTATELGEFETGLTPLNQLINTPKDYLSSSNYAKYQALKNNALKYGQEITKFYAGSGGGVEERREFEKSIKDASGPKVMSEILAKEAELMASKRFQLENQIRGTLGQKYLDEHPVHSKQSEASLDKLNGYISKLSGFGPEGDKKPNTTELDQDKGWHTLPAKGGNPPSTPPGQAAASPGPTPPQPALPINAAGQQGMPGTPSGPAPIRPAPQQLPAQGPMPQMQGMRGDMPIPQPPLPQNQQALLRSLTQSAAPWMPQQEQQAWNPSNAPGQIDQQYLKTLTGKERQDYLSKKRNEAAMSTLETAPAVIGAGTAPWTIPYIARTLPNAGTAVASTARALSPLDYHSKWFIPKLLGYEQLLKHMMGN